MENTTVNIEELLKKTSFGTFDNQELLDQIFKLVMDENDKYPRHSLSNNFFPACKIIRNKSNISDSNVLKLFDDSIEKKNPPQIAQYSFGTRNIEMFKQYQDDEVNGDEKFKFYCLHHNDMDGDASASIVYSKFLSINIYSTPFNYNDTDFKNWIYKVKQNKRKNNEMKKKEGKKENILFVVDLSLKFIELKNILEVFDHVYWIDHHVTSLTSVNNISGEPELFKKLTYFIDTRFCATYLAKYFLKKYKSLANYFLEKLEKYDSKDTFNKEMVVASLINLYDLKLDKQFPEAYKYAVYLNTYYWSFNNISLHSNVWYNLLNTASEDSGLLYSKLNKILDVGKKLFEIDQQKNQLMYDNDYKYILESKFENNEISKLRIIGLFQFGNSIKITGFDDDIPTIKMLIRYNEKDNTFGFSLYTDSEILGNLNLGQIMLKYGLGGGHPKACGGTITFKDSLELTDQIEAFYEHDHEHNGKYYELKDFHYKNNKLPHIFDIYTMDGIEEFKKVSEKILSFVSFDKTNRERFELDIEFLVKSIFCIIAREIITRKDSYC